LQKLKSTKRAFFPGVLTAGNMFCGFLSITYALEGNFLTASWLIILGAVFDAMDGLIARLTRGFSSFGVEFDSLADVITFGAAPAILIYSAHFQYLGILGLLISFLPLVFGAIRLARFNINLTGFEKEKFVGLPIPMQATAISSYLIFTHTIWDAIRFPLFFAPYVLFLAFLMVSHIEYETLPKFTLRRDNNNTRKLILFIAAAIVVILFPKETIFPFTLFFILFSFVRGVIHSLHHEEEEVADISTLD